MKTLSKLVTLALLTGVAVDAFEAAARTRNRLVSRPFWSTMTWSKLSAAGRSEDDHAQQEERKARQKEIRKQFAEGEELKRLRADLESLRENLQWATAMADSDRVFDLEKAIRNGEQRDPDIVYTKALKIIAETQTAKDLSEHDRDIIVERFQDRAQAARSYLPRFQLEGLWVGNYGDHGQELVNVTYVGDTLIASKVTGDVNVPRGQVSFTADLSPRNSSALEPLTLSVDQSSTKAAKLARYPGQGQVAKPGFVDHKYIHGQLVMFDRHFSFVWVPTRHHVLFRRPTPEQTLLLLRDTIAKEDELENMRDHLQRCFSMDMTDSLARQHQLDEEDTMEFRRITLQKDLDEMDNKNNRFNFWGGFKWTRSYLDGVLRDEKKDKP